VETILATITAVLYSMCFLIFGVFRMITALKTKETDSLAGGVILVVMSFAFFIPRSSTMSPGVFAGFMFGLAGITVGALRSAGLPPFNRIDDSLYNLTGIIVIVCAIVLLISNFFVQNVP
jgi:asparagine N-glycosylation enzyme membrane subunit Stt3